MSKRAALARGAQSRSKGDRDSYVYPTLQDVQDCRDRCGEGCRTADHQPGCRGYVIPWCPRADSAPHLCQCSYCVGVFAASYSDPAADMELYRSLNAADGIKIHCRTYGEKEAPPVGPIPTE
ncbi:hypothetical protein GCM10010430_18810 [Kitasatospora cystarginea]|uniref:Uncharacterized protein n=1 Tax=Kitasatospora cystarginea TaxID=58350 RepID=A0ABP5QLY8_9ACTN